jgi:hypothetical protein
MLRGDHVFYGMHQIRKGCEKPSHKLLHAPGSMEDLRRVGGFPLIPHLFIDAPGQSFIVIHYAKHVLLLIGKKCPKRLGQASTHWLKQILRVYVHPKKKRDLPGLVQESPQLALK